MRSTATPESVLDSRYAWMRLAAALLLSTMDLVGGAPHHAAAGVAEAVARILSATESA